MKTSRKLQPPDRSRSLRHIQSTMLSAIRRPLMENESMQPEWTDGRATSEVAQTFIKPNDRLTSFDRLEIYNQQYWWRLLSNIQDDQVGLRAMLGEEKFDALATAYLESFPSRSWSLRDLSGKLTDFIVAQPKWTAPRTTAARDLARFEWAQTVAFDAAQRPRVEGDELLGSQADTLRLGLQPYLSLLDLDYAVDEYTVAVKKKNQSLRNDASNAFDAPTEHKPVKRGPMPKKKRIWLAVHRMDNTVYFKRLDREAFLMLTSLREGHTLAAAVESALAEADAEKDWISIIRGWFQTWAALGWFCKRKD
jgi:hypothetical protein